MDYLKFSLIFLLCGMILAISQTGFANERSDWVAYEDEAGFKLEIPQDWKVRTNQGRINISGRNREILVIFPIKIEENLSLQSAQATLLQMAKLVSPKQQWGMPPNGWQFGKNGVRTVGFDESKMKEVSALWWANTNQGAFGFFYSTSAQTADFNDLTPVFARILGSFKITQTEQENDTGEVENLSYRQWVDPTENAFSFDYPSTWKVSGGIIRASGATRSEINIVSPDENSIVKLNDSKFVLKYAEPNATLSSLGYGEGQMTSSDTRVLRYLSGENFSIYYVQNTVGKICRNLKKIDSKNRTDYVSALAARGFLPPNSSAYTAGEITYSCQIDGKTYVGYQFAETYKVDYSGTANMWNVKQLYGFIAAQNRAATANAVLARAISTTRVNQQWVMGEAQMNRQMADDYQRYLNYSNNLQKETLAERWASQDRIAEARGDLLIGVTKVVDPQTGQSYKVQSGSSYYWIDPQKNVIVGTNQSYKPNWDFRQMIETYK